MFFIKYLPKGRWQCFFFRLPSPGCKKIKCHRSPIRKTPTYQIFTKSLKSPENSSGSSGIDASFSIVIMSHSFGFFETSYGNFPIPHSIRVSPRLQMSVSFRYCSPMRRSGLKLWQLVFNHIRKNIYE